MQDVNVQPRSQWLDSWEKTYKFLSSKPGYVSWRKKICENYTQNKSVTNLLLLKFVSYENFVGSFMDR